MRVIILSDVFFKKYRNCPEILCKENRPYICLSVSIDGLQYGIPIRHHVRHAYSFKTIGEAGLDYTKAVLIIDDTFISNDSAVIDSKEWNIIKKNENSIYAGFSRYLRQYKRALNNPNNPRSEKIVKYSSLQYFDLSSKEGE